MVAEECSSSLRCCRQVILANLFKHTALQSRFPCNMVALVNGTPLSLTLKDFLSHFLDFRCAPLACCLPACASQLPGMAAAADPPTGFCLGPAGRVACSEQQGPPLVMHAS